MSNIDGLPNSGAAKRGRKQDKELKPLITKREENRRFHEKLDELSKVIEECCI